MLPSPSIRQQMKSMIIDLYASPNQKACYYSYDHQPLNQDLNNIIWDWSPEKMVQVEGNSTCIFPLALGCPPIFTKTGEQWVEPLFDENTVLSATEFDLPIVDVSSGYSGFLLENMQKMLPQLEAYEIIRAPDIQSPFGIAELICGSSIYMALIMNPQPIHQLLQWITDFVIRFILEMRKIVGHRLNGTQFPYIWNNHEGTLCSDDSLSLMSPEMHLEFSLPYVNQIADACGSLFYHSCIWQPSYFENIKQVKKVRAYNWNLGNSCDPAHIIEQFSGQAVLAPHFYPDIHKTNDVKKWGNFEDEAEVIRYFLDAMQENTSVYFWIESLGNKPKILSKIYHLMQEYGYSPEARGIL